MLEFYIFLMLFILVLVTAVISSWGWLKSGCKIEELLSENEDLKVCVSVNREAYAKLKAENSFYKNIAEEKKNA